MIYKTKDLVSFRYSKQNCQMCTYNVSAVHSTNLMWQAEDMKDTSHFRHLHPIQAHTTTTCCLIVASHPVHQHKAIYLCYCTAWPPVSNSIKTAQMSCFLSMISHLMWSGISMGNSGPEPTRRQQDHTAPNGHFFIHLKIESLNKILFIVLSPLLTDLICMS